MAMPRWRATGLVILLLGGGCAHEAPPPRSLAAAEDGRAVHRVQPGETLTAIADAYDTTVAELVAANGLADPDALRVGQLLRLPRGIQARPPPEPGPPPDLGRRAPDPVLACEAHGPAPEPWAVSRAGLSWPTDGVVLTRFGNLEGRRHDGLAIGAPRGTPVWASGPGEVILAGTQPGYGRLVVMRHPDGRDGVYASLERLCVQKGARVGRGALLGLVGDSSGVASPRLYFELREEGVPVDPRPRLP